MRGGEARSQSGWWKEIFGLPHSDCSSIPVVYHGQQVINIQQSVAIKISSTERQIGALTPGVNNAEEVVDVDDAVAVDIASQSWPEERGVLAGIVKGSHEDFIVVVDGDWAEDRPWHVG